MHLGQVRGTSAHSAVGAVIALQIGVAVPVFLVSTLAPYLRVDIPLDERVLGLTIAMFYAASSASAFWLGRVADRQPWQRGVVVAGTGLVAVLLLTATVVGSVPALAAVLVAAALVQSLAVGTANLALARVVRPGRQGLAFGVKHAAVPAAMLLAGLAAPLVAERIGWRVAFLLATAFPLLAMVLTGRSPRRTAGTPGAVPPTPAYPAGAPLSVELVEIGQGSAYDAGHDRTGTRRQLGTMTVAAGLGAFSSSSLGAFFVLFGVDRGMSAAAAGTAVASASCVNIVMRILVGAAVDRLGWHPLRIVAALLSVGALGFLLLTGAPGGLLFVAAGLAYGCGWAWQGLVHLGAVRFFPQSPGQATGVVRTGIAAGAGTGPLLSGLLISGYGYAVLWLVLAVLGTGAAVGMVLVARWLRGAPRDDKGVAVV